MMAGLDFCPTCGRRILDFDEGVETPNGQRWCLAHLANRDPLGACVLAASIMAGQLGEHMGPLDTLEISTRFDAGYIGEPGHAVYISWPEWPIQGERWQTLFGPHPVNPGADFAGCEVNALTLYAD